MKISADGTIMKEDYEEGAKIFSKLCDYFTRKELEYHILDTQEEGISVLTACLSGDDLPMDIAMAVNACDNLLIFTSLLPVTFDKAKIKDGALAVCMVNNDLNDGHFDLNVDSGEISFRLCNRWTDSNVGDDIFAYLLQMGGSCVDVYNDKFLLLSKGMISIEDLDKFINGD